MCPMHHRCNVQQLTLASGQDQIFSLAEPSITAVACVDTTCFSYPCVCSFSRLFTRSSPPFIVNPTRDFRFFFLFRANERGISSSSDDNQGIVIGLSLALGLTLVVIGALAVWKFRVRKNARRLMEDMGEGDL